MKSKDATLEAVMGALTEASRENALLKSRLAAIQKVYEQYRHLSVLIMDPLWMIGDANCRGAYRHTIRALWMAINQAEEREKHD